MKNLFYAIKDKETGYLVELPNRLYSTEERAKEIIEVSEGNYKVVKIELKEVK